MSVITIPLTNLFLLSPQKVIVLETVQCEQQRLHLGCGCNLNREGGSPGSSCQQQPFLYFLECLDKSSCNAQTPLGCVDAQLIQLQVYSQDWCFKLLV